MINLLPWRQQRQHTMQISLWIGTALIALCLILSSVGYYFFADKKFTALQQRTQQLHQSLQQIVIVDNSKTFTLLQQKITRALQQRQSLYRLLALLYDSTQSMPRAIFLTHLEWNSPTITLQGISESTTALNRWLQQLQENKYIQDIKPTYRYQQPSTSQQFTVQLKT